MFLNFVTRVVNIGARLVVWATAAEDTDSSKVKEYKISNEFKFWQNPSEKKLQGFNSGTKKLQVVFTRREEEKNTIVNETYHVPPGEKFDISKPIEVCEKGDVTVAELNPHALQDSDSVKRTISFFAGAAAVGSPIYIYDNYIKGMINKLPNGKYTFTTTYEKPIGNWKMKLGLKTARGESFQVDVERKLDQISEDDTWTVDLPDGLKLDPPLAEISIVYDNVPADYYDAQYAEIERRRASANS